LYVDDEAAIRRAVVAWLTRRGHIVHAVGNLADARRLLQSQAVDGAFVDLWLGDESGLELQDWIDEHRPELSPNVVFVTGDLALGNGVGGPLAQLNRPILAKPFDLEQLDEFVAGWLERNGR
jgi:two-component system response regulator PilR (NtrC family)